ncbi:hypothetical protein CKF54_05365 [Psittacicella hinzii]|uniref:Uncharacterized protein n=1 Tax=Psittacicella hinzii TaxID=2028575 RepID=A0A3A1Y4A8_9GAMM|nr:hypothetical protein [Psittacicella hinzii]RIY32139.1 hypothetical protein CKF54_05365 [Psittacicella hinzii]
MSLQLQPIGLELDLTLNPNYSLTEFLHGPNEEVITTLTPYFSLGLSQTVALIGDSSTLVNQMVKACYDDASKLNPFLDEREQSFIDLAEFIKEKTPQDLADLYYQRLIAFNNVHTLLGKLEWEEALRDLITMIDNSYSLLIVGTHVDIADSVCVLPDLQSRFKLFTKLYLKAYSSRELKEFITYRCHEQGLALSPQGIEHLTQVYQSVHPNGLDLDQTAININRLCNREMRQANSLSASFLQQHPEVFKLANLSDDLLDYYQRQANFDEVEDEDDLHNPNQNQPLAPLTKYGKIFTRFKRQQALNKQNLREREKLLPQTAQFAVGFANYFREKYPELDNYEPDPALLAYLGKSEEEALQVRSYKSAKKLRQEKVLRLLQKHIQQADDNRNNDTLAHQGIDDNYFFMYDDYRENALLEEHLQQTQVTEIEQVLAGEEVILGQTSEVPQSFADKQFADKQFADKQKDEIITTAKPQLNNKQEDNQASAFELGSNFEHVANFAQLANFETLAEFEQLTGFEQVANFEQTSPLIQLLFNQDLEAGELFTVELTSPTLEKIGKELNAPLSRLLTNRKRVKDKPLVDFTTLLKFE